MEGYQPIDDASLEAGKDKLVYLIKLPKDVNLQSLNGVELDLSKESAGILKGESGLQYTITKEKKGAYKDRIRPVLVDAIVGSGGISRGFDGAISVALSLDTASTDPSKRIVNTCPSTYPRVPQLDFLTVRTIPRGSTTTLSELKKRKEEGSVVKKSKKSKHTHEPAAATPATPVVAVRVVDVVDIESEEKKSKKEKKEKKEKKDKKDKSSRD